MPRVMSLSYAPLSEIRPVSFSAYPWSAYPQPYLTIGTSPTVRALPVVTYVQRPGYVVYNGAYPWWGRHPSMPRAYASAVSSSSTSTVIRV